MDSNEYYNQYASIYFENTVNLDVTHLIEPFTSYLEEGASVLALGTALMFGAEGHREKLSRLSPGVKCAGAALLLLITLVFGCYGLGYDAGSFIYAVF